MGKITRTHLTEAKRTSGVICVYKDCFAELTAGAFKNHFEAQHLAECAPPVWNPEFHKLYSVGRRERARLAKFGLLDMFLQEEIQALRRALEEQGALIARIAEKLGVDVAPAPPAAVAVQPTASTENPVVTTAPAASATPETPSVEETAVTTPKPTGKKKRARPPQTQQSPSRKSTRKAKSAVIDETTI